MCKKVAAGAPEVNFLALALTGKQARLDLGTNHRDEMWQFKMQCNANNAPKWCMWNSVPTKTQLSNFLGTPGEDYFKGTPKSLIFYFLVIWWGKNCCISEIDMLVISGILKITGWL